MQFAVRAGLAATILALAPLAALAEGAKVAIHVDEERIETMNMALNNAANIISHYEGLGQDVTVEIVTYGPGLHMLREDTSPVADRISTMALTHDNLSFSACLNTVQAMQQRAQTEIPLLSEANVVPSGAVRLMELQYDGYAYLRP
ncbi:MAG: hypothetical protein HLUCCA05_01700 [Roseibaca calidilacus]|uniref:Uncharacterized protein n=1 Tax=Roseibaca calidilacus TaxID=1666912 RepID=A0A0N8K7I8_9RHOB|nr:DsrE family protein [Roseibaca calidilacus]KPP91857.1 MAG: hypothetical protein HLUCCA05_01700 [Roseibaca calidilacus]CUX82399.1 hypothetical protein Ga0058931_2351 [Roseibaca calidilacus]